MYTIEKDESKAINALRVIFTIMVVYIHSHVGAEKLMDQTHWLNVIEYLISEVICRCAVPGFFLISSIMLYRKPFRWKDNMKKKVQGILVPYILMNTVWVVFFLITKKIPALSEFFNTPASDIYNWTARGWINAYLGIDGLPMLGQTWFLRDLFVINILAVLLKKVIDKIPVLWIALLSLLWLVNYEIPIFCISIRSIYFFSLGYYVVKYDFHIRDIKKMKSSLITILFLVLSFVDTVFRVFVGKVHYSIFIGDLAHQMMILVGLLLFTKVAFEFYRIENNNIYKKLLKYNFCIYLFHEMTLTILRKVILKVFGARPLVQFIGYIILPVIVIGGSVLLAVFLEKRCSVVYRILTGNRNGKIKVVEQEKV